MKIFFTMTDRYLTSEMPQPENSLRRFLPAATLDMAKRQARDSKELFLFQSKRIGVNHLNHRFSVLICVLGCTASSLPAQLGAYLGPGVLSRGAGDVGTRSGQQVDLRFYGDVSGVYDTGLQPFALDSKGNLITINGLYGIVADVGA